MPSERFITISESETSWRIRSKNSEENLLPENSILCPIRRLISDHTIFLSQILCICIFEDFLACASHGIDPEYYVIYRICDIQNFLSFRRSYEPIYIPISLDNIIIERMYFPYSRGYFLITPSECRNTECPSLMKREDCLSPWKYVFLCISEAIDLRRIIAMHDHSNPIRIAFSE